MTGDDEPATTTVYDAVGGQPFFDALAARYDERVRADVVLRPLHLEDDPGERGVRREPRKGYP